MCFHQINAYEEQGHLVFDLVSHDDGDEILDQFYLKELRHGTLTGLNAQCRRYVLPLDIGLEVKYAATIQEHHPIRT